MSDLHRRFRLLTDDKLWGVIIDQGHAIHAGSAASLDDASTQLEAALDVWRERPLTDDDRRRLTS